jgi:hypothetical protein
MVERFPDMPASASKRILRARTAVLACLLLCGLLVVPDPEAARAAPHQAQAVPWVFGLQTFARPPHDVLIMDRFRASGAAWARMGNVDWSSLEASPGVIAWSKLRDLDRALAGLSARGVRVQLILFGTPTWVREFPNSSCGPIRPDKYAAFARFATQVVQRYSKAPYNVKQWEVWNEPDAPVNVNGTEPYGCWGRVGTTYYGGDAYGRMLKTVYPAIKAADPGATVSLGGLLMGCGIAGGACGVGEQPGLKFLRGVLAAGAGNSFDVLSFHSYPGWLPTRRGVDWDRQTDGWQSQGGMLVGKLHGLRTVMGSLRKPIVMNEGGLLWCSEEQPTSWCRQQGITVPGPDYREDQANYLARLYTRSWAFGLQGASWYYLESGGWRGAACSTVTPPRRPAPATGRFRC